MSLYKYPKVLNQVTVRVPTELYNLTTINEIMLKLNKRIPGMQSAEYQATILLKLFIIIHNYANV